jgi:hypothetical protein
MKKTKTLILTTALLMGGLLNSFGQTGCGWVLNDIVGQPTCYKVCNGYVSVAPTVNWPFTYLWSNGSTSNTIDNLCENEYTVTATDDKGCSQTYTYSIVEPQLLVAACTTLTNESYPGAADGSIMASATGGTGAYTFVWQVANPVYTPLISGLSGGLYYVIVSDENDCSTSTSCSIITDKKKECDTLRTQTQGGWGQCQLTGNNPGTYLYSHFAAAFPTGLQIGSTRKLKLTSAQAVCDFLPSGSSPAVLPSGTLTNPVTYQNVFAGQLVAATINVKFDYIFASFSPSVNNLGDMIIASGPFIGKTVNFVLAEANKKIGGTASVYTLSQLNNALDMINNNYTDGTQDNGFLVCPEDARFSSATVQEMTISVYPNPTDNYSNVSVYSAADENISVEVFNIAGQRVQTAFNGMVEGGQTKVVKIDGSDLISGVYFVKVIAADKVYNQKLVLKK